MNIPQDPAMLLSFINLKLRDYYDSFDKLCEELQLDGDAIKDKLAMIDYEYDESSNRFV